MFQRFPSVGAAAASEAGVRAPATCRPFLKSNCERWNHGRSG
jgi:hypothetical protein